MNLGAQDEAENTPVLRQRIGAYAVITQADQVLLTRLSAQSVDAGLWTLPGGGVDHGEHPQIAVAREVHEETGHVLASTQLLDVTSRQFIGRSPAGVLEDFHHVQILYRAHVITVKEPEVLDVGGSTDLAQWISILELGQYRVSTRTLSWLENAGITLPARIA